MGKVPQKAITTMEKGLLKAYGNVSIEILPTKPMPGSCYYKPRNRYRADKILDWIEQQNYNDSINIVIAVTTKDISTTKGKHYDWGIFGLGTLGGYSSVISTYRLKSGVSETKLHDRIRKIAIHEVGHTYGFDHCPNKGCVMQDCKGSIKPVDQETGEFCAVCYKTLKFVYQKQNY